MKLISSPSREACWQDQTVAFFAPPKIFLISEASPVPRPLSQEQFGLGGSCGVVLGHEPTVYSRPTKKHMQFRVQPASQPDQQWRFSHVTRWTRAGAKLGRGACYSRRKGRWSNRAWVSGSPLIEKFTLGSGGPHSPDSIGAVCKNGKVLDRLCNADNWGWPL